MHFSTHFTRDGLLRSPPLEQLSYIQSKVRLYSPPRSFKEAFINVLLPPPPFNSDGRLD